MSTLGRFSGEMMRRRFRIWLCSFSCVVIAALPLGACLGIARAAPHLRFDRGVHAARSYAAEICAKRCTSWTLTKCQRFTARNVGCSFVGRLLEEDICKAKINAFLLPNKQGGSTLGVSGSFNAKSCPAELGKPPANTG